MSPWVTNLPNRPEQPRVVIIFELFINVYYNNIVINRGMHNPADYHVPPFLGAGEVPPFFHIWEEVKNN